MKKLVAIVCLLAVSACAAMAAGMAKSGSLERTMTVRTTGASAVETEKFFWKNDKLRAEKYSITGMLIQIKDGKTIYIYNPSGKEAMKAVMPDKAAKTVQQMLAEESVSIKGGKKVGTAKVAGFACDVYMLSKKVGGMTRSAKAYLCTDSRLPIPLKMEITMGKITQIIETKNIKLNTNLADSMFVLPKGTKVTVQKAAAPTAPKTK